MKTFETGTRSNGHFWLRKHDLYLGRKDGSEQLLVRLPHNAHNWWSHLEYAPSTTAEEKENISVDWAICVDVLVTAFLKIHRAGARDVLCRVFDDQILFSSDACDANVKAVVDDESLPTLNLRAMKLDYRAKIDLNASRLKDILQSMEDKYLFVTVLKHTNAMSLEYQQQANANGVDEYTARVPIEPAEYKVCQEQLELPFLRKFVVDRWKWVATSATQLGGSFTVAWNTKSPVMFTVALDAEHTQDAQWILWLAPQATKR